MPDWKPACRFGPLFATGSSVNGYWDHAPIRGFLKAIHSAWPRYSGTFLIGVCTGSGGSLWMPNSVDQTACRPRDAKRFLRVSVSSARVILLSWPIDTSSRFGRLTLGPPANV